MSKFRYYKQQDLYRNLIAISLFAVPQYFMQRDLDETLLHCVHYEYRWWHGDIGENDSDTWNKINHYVLLHIYSGANACALWSK